MKKMTKLLFCLIMILAIAVPATTALAAPKYAGVQPSCDEAGNVTIPPLPVGRLLNVQIYDDVRGIPPRDIGAKASFKLEEGAGFNFQWVDLAGQVWFQMVTPQTRATGLVTDCTHSGGCKYVYKKK